MGRSVCPPFSPSSRLCLSSPNFSQMCLFLLCTVGSFSEHLDQINGRSECVDSTDNSSKPSSEPTSHMARQRLESTEKKKISGKVTKSLSASALSLMIPGGRETSFDSHESVCFVHVPPSLLPQSGMPIEMQNCTRQSPSGIPGQLSGAAAYTPMNFPSRTSGAAREHVHLHLSSHSVSGVEARDVSFP